MTIPTSEWNAPTTNVPISPYALQHPDAYALRPTAWLGGKVLHVELCLLDAEGEFIDEWGCNCDMDDPCNNPQCVKDREGKWY